MTLAELNQLSAESLATALEKCCGATRWYQTMANFQPFPSVDSLHQTSDNIWHELEEADYLEAFSHHPMIGDIDSLKAKFATTAVWAENEQQGSQLADETTLLALKQGNEDYLSKFGFIFIVCATGKTASQMLDLLNRRLPNNYQKELEIAAAEQNKITHLRLNKLLSE